MNITGIILAGGKNSRMGKPKAFLEVNGSRLIDTILNTYRKIFSEIIIVTNDPLDYLEFPDTVIATDIYKGKGALGGIYTGLHFASNDYSFVAACDMPFLNSGFISSMIALAVKHDIIVPGQACGYQPLHAIYSKNCLTAVKKLITADKLKIIGFYNELRLLKIPEEKIKPFDPTGRMFQNINTPEDLTAVKAEN
jgi:molybdopterin-guanine dinucleotide biosynthesis protein A